MQTYAPTDAEAYRGLARCWAANVNVVTVRRRAEAVSADAPELDGFTATAFLTVSIDPPLIAVSVSNETSALSMIRDSDQFAVNLLATGQQELANTFAGPARDRLGIWDEIDWKADADGVPLIVGAQGAFSARPKQLIPAGDHTLVIGEVTGIHMLDGEDSLVYRARSYCRVTPLE